MSTAFEHDPTRVNNANSPADVEGQKSKQLSRDVLLEALGARVYGAQSAVPVSELFFEKPMCWLGVRDVLGPPFRSRLVELTGVSDEVDLRGIFFQGCTELKRVELLQSRQLDDRIPSFEGTQFRYNPKLVEKLILNHKRAEAARKAGSTAMESAWQDQANCLGLDPDLFFPLRGASTREAREVCRGCTVRLDCLEVALENVEKYGIWGGMSERERRRLRRQRNLFARKAEQE